MEWQGLQGDVTSSKGGGERLLSGGTKAKRESQEPLAFPGQGRQAAGSRV